MSGSITKNIAFFARLSNNIQIMCRYSKKFVAFFIALTLGITAVMVIRQYSAQSNANYYESNSQPYVSAREFTTTEQQLMAAMRKVKIRDTENQIARSNFGSETAEFIRRSYSSRGLTESLELKVDALNAGCTEENLSDSDCEEKKLAAIRHIEENILSAGD